MNGGSVDNPQVANLVSPQAQMTVNGVKLDMHKFAAAADRVGAGKLDVLSIDGYRNGKNEWVPDYDSVRIVRKGGVT